MRNHKHDLASRPNATPPDDMSVEETVAAKAVLMQLHPTMA